MNADFQWFLLHYLKNIVKVEDLESSILGFSDLFSIKVSYFKNLGCYKLEID